MRQKEAMPNDTVTQFLMFSRWVGSIYFRDFSFADFRRRTPAPPPFSSMNSMPVDFPI